MIVVDFKVVAVAAVKGGVGKSTVSLNLALELKERGLRVGILDADVDSPYLVEMGGVRGKIGLDMHRRMVPVQRDGIPIMSFGLWSPEGFGGASMEGDMHRQWIWDALEHTAWGPLDVLVIDLPAGSGDELLVLKKIPVEDFLGIVAVGLSNLGSSLQRLYNVASYHKFPILGVIENMAGPVFGTGRVEGFCRETGLRFSGSIPMDARIRAAHENGDPRLPLDARAAIEAVAVSVIEEGKLGG